MKVISYMYRVINFIYLYLTFKNKHIEIDTNEIKNIHGIPYIKNDGFFCIKGDIVINSRYSMNPIGGQEYCTFVVAKGAKMVIDKGARISNSTFICWNNIYIGEHVYIGGDCKIYDTDFHSVKYYNRIKKIDNDIKSNPICIKKGAFIGTGSIILKGVTIGEKSIIGAGSVVSRDIPDNEIWAGNPARFIKKVS